MTEFEEKAIELLERLAYNQPGRDDLRFVIADGDTVPAGSSLTLAWELQRGFEIMVTDLYCDARDDCDYYWLYAGILYNFNELTFPYGKRMSAGQTVRLVVTNSGIVDTEVGYYINGWGRIKPAKGE